MKKTETSSTFYIGNNVPVKIGKNFGIGFIMASFFFLFNPNMAVFDVLPDIIGYVLMCIALSKLSFINESFDSAHKNFKKLIFVEISKVLALLVMFSVFDARNREYAFLLHTFTFLVIDLIFVIPAFKNLYEGFSYLSERYNTEVILLSQNKDSNVDTTSKEINVPIKLLKYTIFFVILKPLLTTLPEFIVLGQDDNVNNKFFYYMYDFIYHYRIIAMLIVLIFGIIWLVRSYKYFSSILKDSDFVNYLKKLFSDNVLPREGVFVRRTIKTGLAFLIAAAIFSIDVHFSDLNILPDFVSAIFFFMSAYIMRYYVKSYKKVVLTSSIFGCLSIVASVLKIVFLSKFNAFSAANHFVDAENFFYVMAASSVVENIAFIFMIFSLVVFIKEIILNYTGYVSIRTDYTSESRLKEIHKSLSMKLLAITIFAILGAISASVFDFLLPERNYFAQIYWCIDALLQSIFAIMVIHESLAIGDEVDSRYMLA